MTRNVPPPWPLKPPACLLDDAEQQPVVRQFSTWVRHVNLPDVLQAKPHYHRFVPLSESVATAPGDAFSPIETVALASPWIVPRRFGRRAFDEYHSRTRKRSGRSVCVRSRDAFLSRFP